MFVLEGRIFVLYVIRNGEVKTVSVKEVNAEELCVGCLTLEELQECYGELGITEHAMQECVNNLQIFYNSVEVFERFSFGIISVIDMMELQEIRKQVGFFFQKNLFLLVRLSQKTNAELDEKIRRCLTQIHEPITMEKMLCSVLEQLFISGNQELVFTERMVTVIEQQVGARKIDEHLDQELFELRNRVAVLKTFSSQMLDIAETLMADKNEILGTKDLLYLRNLATKAERMGERSQTINNALLHLWELLDARMNQQMNDTMTMLSVVSIIFLPMSVIAGWYGMNFVSMPEFAWKFGYLYVILLNVLLIGGITFVFKRKKML